MCDFHDTLGMGGLCLTEQSANGSLAYLVITFLIEINFIDRTAGGDNEYFFWAKANMFYR